ncbi:WD40-repeat-containing domain protein [Coprinopsis sp. MPI-PUGE-AT-0042]|nr:WD40-repeat-containing domain protein [Coprinopsis sp. MPI-PUGE-AT-0042]
MENLPACLVKIGEEPNFTLDAPRDRLPVLSPYFEQDIEAMGPQAKSPAIGVSLELLPETRDSEAYILLDAAEAKDVLEALPHGLQWSTNGDVLASGYEVLAMGVPPVLLFSLAVLGLLQAFVAVEKTGTACAFLTPRHSLRWPAWSRKESKESMYLVLRWVEEEREDFHENPPAADSILKGRTLRLVQATEVSCTYTTNTNYGLLSSHAKAPILDLYWSLPSPPLYSVSADHCFSVTDLTTGQKVRRICAHREIINIVDRTKANGSGTELITTASDDATVKIFEGGEEASKQPVATLNVRGPATAICWNADGSQIYVGALDNEVHVYDLREQEQVYSLRGHNDTPTSLALSLDGNYLLAPSLSSQTIIHDVRPFSPSATRVHRLLLGSPAGFENTLLRGAWSKDDGGHRVAVGGADRMVCIWEVETSKILYKLPGHKGTVTSVDFHPKEPIILTGSKGGTMLLGEIEPTITV